MRRQKQQVEPLALQSPEQDLCEISMQIDQTDFSSNFMAPFAPQKQLRFDGWVRVESKADEKLATHRSHIIENLSRPVKQQDPLIRYSPTRSLNKRTSLQENSRSSKEELSLARVQSMEMPKESETDRDMYHSAYLQESPNSARKGSFSREAGRTERRTPSKMQVGTVNYPILQLGVNDPQKKYMFHIGRIRRMINSKGKRK